jgi:hypothetical protein
MRVMSKCGILTINARYHTPYPFKKKKKRRNLDTDMEVTGLDG